VTPFGIRCNTPLLYRGCCRGLQSSKLPSLAKEGWTRHKEKCREATFQGADGVVRSTTDYLWLEPTTPSAPAKEASRHSIIGRSHPSFAKEGSFLARSVRQQPLPRGEYAPEFRLSQDR
jgi:hypothetical protein